MTHCDVSVSTNVVLDTSNQKSNIIFSQLWLYGLGFALRTMKLTIIVLILATLMCIGSELENKILV